MKKLSISIGIASYNAENNIYRLIDTLMQQTMFARVKNILIYSDGSRDQTVHIAKSIRSKKVRVIAGKVRKGYAWALRYLLKKSVTDISILFNDDIIINDKNLIEKIIHVFEHNKKVGLLSANTAALPARTFVEKAFILNLFTFKCMAQSIKNGHNKFNCDGKVLALSKQLVQKVEFPKNLNKVGNADEFSKKYKFPFYIIQNFGIKKYQYFIALSNALKQKLKLVNKGAIIEVIPRGIDKKYLNIKAKEKNYVLFLGRLDIYQKGIDTLLKAWKKFEKQGLILVIAGGGKAQAKKLASNFTWENITDQYDKFINLVKTPRDKSSGALTKHFDFSKNQSEKYNS